MPRHGYLTHATKTRGPEQEPDQDEIPSRLPSSFQSNTKRANRMANANLPGQPDPFRDPTSNWRRPDANPAPVAKPAPDPAPAPTRVLRRGPKYSHYYGK